MKFLVFDQKEFVTDSEQCLFIASSHVKHFSEIEEFALASEKANNLAPISPIKGKLVESRLSNLNYSAGLITNIKEHCSVNLQNHDTVFVIHDNWDIHDFIFQSEHSYYRYLWSTTA